MSHHRPRHELTTHTVTNQAPPLENYNLFETDPILQSFLTSRASHDMVANASAYGAYLGQASVFEHARLANVHEPTLRTFDRYGHRIDEVRFHPSYHEIFRASMAHGVHSVAWDSASPHGHVVHTVLEYMLAQVEGGVCCPLTMTYAAIPTLAQQDALANVWLPRLKSRQYDPRMLPASQKTSATVGMAMTEKQGGSDIRANTTTATPVDREGPGEPYLLRGHKWFCSAPMCDAFLTLAHTSRGISCFLVPRWLPDDTRNPIYIQRLKDKLGNRSNASSEIEYLDTWGWMLGEEGRGVRTILTMVHHTRLDCTLAASGLMRQATVQAIHHAQHRRAFGKRLIDQPLMQNVLADLALETEAATLLSLRIAETFDQARTDSAARPLSRIGVAVAKYWNNKRCPAVVVEAMEAHGGAGYVEESILPRLYREAPLNGIWEGSGNVICLDVLRAMSREPETVPALFEELNTTRGADGRLDALVHQIKTQLADAEQIAFRARRITEDIALALQTSLMIRHAPEPVADAWCASRLAATPGIAFGTLPAGTDATRIIQRAWPPAC